eukprot:scaffold6.g2549.t1
MLPVTTGPSGPRRGGNGAGSGAARQQRLGYTDQFLLACCVAATCFLLWRLHSFSGAGLGAVHGRAAGGISVISTTTVGKGKGGAVVTELVIDKDGKAKSTTVTQDDSGLSVTVLSDEEEAGLGSAALEYRLQQQQRAAERRRQQQERDQQLYPGLPRGFDAQAYLAYHPDLHKLGVTTEDAAKQHYLDKGRAEGRLYRRVRVMLRYTACTGLINQHYSHIAAFSLAAVLGAEIVLPPAVCRDSFAHYFSVFKEKNEVQWSPVPLDSLLDVEHIISFWRARGLVVHRTPELRPFPDLTQPDVAFPMYPQGGIDPSLVTRLEGVYLKDLDMSELMEMSRAAVVGLASSVLKDDPGADLQYLVLDLPCSFFMLRSLSSLRVVTEVAKSLHFAPPLLALADRIVEGMTAGGQLPYNGVHLRIEKDARDWAMIMGGQQVVWHGYIKTMRQVGFDNATRLYVASGMLTYGASVDMDRTIGYLKHVGVCSDVHHKERYIPQSEIEKLNSEQKALLDFIVLARSKRFVGFGSSTFSFYLREYRALHGISRKRAGLVDASIIGTDPLFHSAGTVV